MIKFFKKIFRRKRHYKQQNPDTYKELDSMRGMTFDQFKALGGTTRESKDAVVVQTKQVDEVTLKL